MAEMNGGVQPGSQPVSGSNGSGNGGFEMVGVGMGMGVSPPCSTVGGLSMTDVTLEQALARMHELVRENAELKEYLKENNEMMKKQFETLSQWKQKVHDANVANREKFEQTRALITALRSENEELQTTVKVITGKEDSMTNKIRLLETELNTLKTAKAASDQLAYNVVKQAEQQGVEMGGEETQMTETVYVASAEKEERIMELEAEMEKMKEEVVQLKDRSAHLEHDNAQFRLNTEQLLKDLESTQRLKQQIQKENEELRQETVELQQQVQSMLAESKNSLQRNQKMQAMAFHLRDQRKDDTERSNVPIPGSTQEGELDQTPDRTVDDWQESSAAVTAEVEQLRKQLLEERQQVETLTADNAVIQLEVSQLRGQVEVQKSELEMCQAQHEDRIRQLQHEHERRVEEIVQQKTEDSSLQQQQTVTATHAEDVQTLRSQVLTLINEVHETQNKLAAAQRVIETKTSRVKELEAYSSQIVEESRRQNQHLQQTLAMMEKHLFAEQQGHATTKQQMNELRKSFNQLVTDYKELLDTFDSYKADQEQQMHSTSQQKQQMDAINHLTAQVLAAEEAINVREDRISKLQQELHEKDETVAVLQAQAEVFRFDFTAERDARSQLATDKDRLAQELEAEQLKSQGLSDQLMRYTQQQLQDMQLRASQGTAAPHFYNYPRHNTYPAQPEAYQHAAGYMMGGGGDGGAGGSFNDLSGGEDGHVMQGQNYGGGGGGQSYGAGGRQNYGAGGGQNYGGGGGQHYGGGGQNYPGRQHYPGQEGSLHPQAGHNMPPPQGTVVDSQHGSAHAQYQQTQGGGGRGASQPRQHEEEEQTLYICPSCQQRLPDLDTLTIHVQDCLEQNSSEAAHT